MTEKAIEILRRGDNGFFLMVEGGRIDHAHHDTLANRAVMETVALDVAFEVGSRVARWPIFLLAVLPNGQFLIGCVAEWSIFEGQNC